MIKITINRFSDSSIYGFEAEGHALFAKAGHDIVCAGVSAVTVGTVNAIEALLGVELDHKMKDGFLQASLPSVEHSPDVRERVQLLLESMVVMLDTIQKSYGEYITILDRLYNQE